MTNSTRVHSRHHLLNRPVRESFVLYILESIMLSLKEEAEALSSPRVPNSIRVHHLLNRAVKDCFCTLYFRVYNAFFKGRGRGKGRRTEQPKSDELYQSPQQTPPSKQTSKGMSCLVTGTDTGKTNHKMRA